MSVGLGSWMVSWNRERIYINNSIYMRAMSSGVMADNKSFERVSITSNLSLELKGPVTGKELKTADSSSETNIKHGNNRPSRLPVISTTEQREYTAENDSESITSFEELDREKLISVLLNKNQKQGDLRGIFDIIISPNNLSMAWKEIKSKPGNLTPSMDSLTLDGISANTIVTLSNNLKANKHKYTALRTVYIPKSNNPGETRPLAIASPRDKIIQQAFKRVLEIIFEGLATSEEVDETTFKEAETGLNEK